MSYGDAKTQFAALLNRRDLTASLTETFMGLAIQRIQTEVRVPAMEKSSVLVTDGSANLSIPGDFLEVISLYTDIGNGGRKLIKVDLQTALTNSVTAGMPVCYHRITDAFVIGPYPPTGTNIYINYYADSSGLYADGDENWLTEVTPMLLIYAALAYAADYYSDDRLANFENRYTQVRDNLIMMAQQDELVNASISSAYNPDGQAYY